MCSRRDFFFSGFYLDHQSTRIGKLLGLASDSSCLLVESRRPLACRRCYVSFGWRRSLATVLGGSRSCRCSRISPHLAKDTALKLSVSLYRLLGESFSVRHFVLSAPNCRAAQMNSHDLAAGGIFCFQNCSKTYPSSQNCNPFNASYDTFCKGKINTGALAVLPANGSPQSTCWSSARPPGSLVVMAFANLKI